MECQICGCVLSGRLDFIPVTLLCDSCCVRRNGNCSEEYGSRYTVSEAYAKDYYGLAEKDLAQLKYMTLIFDAYGQWTEQRRYIRSEAEFLLAKRRRNNFEEVTGIRVTQIDVRLRGVIAAEYVTQVQSVQPCFTRLKNLCGVIDRAIVILDARRDAHPQDVLEFCTRNPESGPKEFAPAVEKATLIFRIFGTQILHWLPLNDLWQLTNGPLADVYEEYRSWSPEGSSMGHDDLVGCLED